MIWIVVDDGGSIFVSADISDRVVWEGLAELVNTFVIGWGMSNELLKGTKIFGNAF